MIKDNNVNNNESSYNKESNYTFSDDDILDVITPRELQLDSSKSGKTKYYSKYLEQYKTGKLFFSWNWPALFFRSFWAFYRKMQFSTVLLIVIAIYCFNESLWRFIEIFSVNMITANISWLSKFLSLTFNNSLFMSIGWWLQVLGPWILWGLLANWIYGFHIRNTIRNKLISKGTSIANAIGIYVILIVVSLLIGAVVLYVFSMFGIENNMDVSSIKTFSAFSDNPFYWFILPTPIVFFIAMILLGVKHEFSINNAIRKIKFLALLLLLFVAFINLVNGKELAAVSQNIANSNSYLHDENFVHGDTKYNTMLAYSILYKNYAKNEMAEIKKQAVSVATKNQLNHILTLLDKSIMLFNNNADAYYERGFTTKFIADIYEKEHKNNESLELYNKVIVDLTKAISIKKEVVNSYNDSYKTYVENGSIDSAQAQLLVKQFSLIKKEYIEEYKLRSETYRALGDTKNAVQDNLMAEKLTKDLKL